MVTLMIPRESKKLVWFAHMWAIAALFHLSGNARDALNNQPILAILSLLIAIAAIYTLITPLKRQWLTILCVLIPLHAWQETPVIGNHWILAAFLSLAWLFVAARKKFVISTRWEDFIPTAQLTLLAAYGFAAFAKVNTDFLDPAVSCAVYYHDQLVRSWGLSELQASDSPLTGRVIAVLAMLTELAIFVALAIHKIRRLGLILAFSFHWLLAMNLGQHFWDFSSVLFAGFLLFLDDVQVARLQIWADRAAYIAPRQTLLRLFVVVVGVSIAGLNIVAPFPEHSWALLLIGHAAWWLYGTAVLFIVLASLLSVTNGSNSNSYRSVGILIIIPVIAIFNGLTPYLEIKTGFSWNMYSNLRTVAGQTNHLLIPRTLDLTGAQRDLVRIFNTSDPNLDQLRVKQYGLPFVEFRKYAQDHPEESVTYERGGVIRHVDRLGDDSLSYDPIDVAPKRLLSFRAVDLQTTERCRPVFYASR
ncbi:conserved hypothetical protein; putative membrane protein [Deinococcus deserti VCD115]|uniref:Uncharacterized protein n=1 Tax=Deinococcus deserti (strain DSM 17065 / CIP 109153 / LMG 22923 / VCD115) TaxID=546414 RepID=C1D0Y3_DEIDV|nr:conserved hypothetical protein; putative membrane protein [Deinococcus deserti VCD115]